jgi:hypothetical protein
MPTHRTPYATHSHPLGKVAHLLEDYTEHQADNHEQDDEAKECPETHKHSSCRGSFLGTPTTPRPSSHCHSAPPFVGLVPKVGYLH